jgi:DNA-binding GntR family transcriptional regulator
MSNHRKIFKESLSDQVYAMLRADLIDLHYKPGSRIIIEELEKELGISRLPIRDALQKLIDEGLVIKRPRVGYFVVRFSKEDIVDLFRVRALLENFSLSSGFEVISHESLFSLRDKYEKFKGKNNFSEEDKDNLFELEELFHRDLIIVNSKSPLIIKLYDDIKTKIKMVSRMTMRLDRDIVEHLEVLEAIIDKDKERALKMLHRHLDSAKKTIFEELLRKV